MMYVASRLESAAQQGGRGNALNFVGSSVEYIIEPQVFFFFSSQACMRAKLNVATVLLNI